jgi:hypothetical protein
MIAPKKGRRLSACLAYWYTPCFRGHLSDKPLTTMVVASAWGSHLLALLILRFQHS